jgi:hypothetical protein
MHNSFTEFLVCFSLICYFIVISKKTLKVSIYRNPLININTVKGVTISNLNQEPDVTDIRED